mmetsp:Transcript_6798/g.10622  ORF Transcript_6798/g.10622 Transcript_6798/m.10622 type:complete len:305 (-) Transcript_6798:991-1905(-)
MTVLAAMTAVECRWSTNELMSPAGTSAASNRAFHPPLLKTLVSSITIFPRSKIPRTRTSTSYFFFNSDACASSWASSAPPISPAPITPTERTVPVKNKRECAALRARAASFRSITAEILRSLEPWAIARTLTLFFPRASKNLAAMPVVCDIRSPTTATIAHPTVNSIAEIRLWWISRKNAFSRVSFANSPLLSGMAKQMECSDDDWAIRMTLMPTSFREPNTLCAHPGTPIMPVPSTLISAAPSIAEKPLTAMAGVMGPLEVAYGLLQILVPGQLELKVLRMYMGIFLAMAGIIVWGWITLAPK